MRSMLMVLATTASMALLGSGVAMADTVTTNFEPNSSPPAFIIGTVDAQDGWRSTGPYDQGVVANGGSIAGFGTQSLRMSNAVTSGNFSDQTYSKPTTTPAGETQANTEYMAEFSFISTTASPQPGLFLSVSPDSGEGSRMSWVGLEDTPAGIRVTVSDTPKVDGEFADYDAGLLDRAVPHTIGFWIKLNPGVNNDLVRISIDGRNVGQCFTTWENYYRTSPEQEPPPNVNTPASINSLQFRSGGTAVSDLAGGGYLFDNVTVTTAKGTGPAGCGDGVPVGKEGAPVVPQITPLPAKVRADLRDLARAVAALRGPSKCVRRARYTVVVKGSPITRVTFRVDGKRVRTLNARKGQRRFRVVLGATRRRSVVTARVHFAGDATARAATLRKIIRRCRLPRFTG